MIKLASQRMDATPAAPAARGSVIIPAHNEEASIGLCLSALLAAAEPGEFEIIVVCNGCTDDTAGAARSFGARVRVIEIEVGSKIIALNLGNKAARYFPRLYLDSDLELSTRSARALLAAAREPGCCAAIGHMETNVDRLPWLMRQYYAVWSRHGYLRHGKFGGAYALSEEGCNRIGVLPPVINDDEYVRRKIPASTVSVVEGCSFRAELPRTLRDLLKVRIRVHRGNRQLRDLARASGSVAQPVHQTASGGSPVVAASLKPSLWVGVATYVAVNALAKYKARRHSMSWGRDESSRRARAEGTA